MEELTEDILRQAAQGDVNAFEAVYRSYATFVYNVAYRISLNREDAEEVTQEVFITVYKQLSSFLFQSSFKTWVYRITANYAINFSKKVSKTRNKTMEYDDTLFEPTASGDVRGEMDKEHHSKAINDLLSVINPDQRACIVLRNIEGLSYQQIADALKINVNTVRTRLKRAREKLLTLKDQVNYGHM